jgi:hypothetical protein
MNLIYGIQDNNKKIGNLNRLTQKVESAYNRPYISWPEKGGPLLVKMINHGNTLIGYAHAGTTHLAYIGAIHQPVENWKIGSPLDEPNKTASFILDEYHHIGVSIFGKL